MVILVGSLLAGHITANLRSLISSATSLQGISIINNLKSNAIFQRYAEISPEQCKSPELSQLGTAGALLLGQRRASEVSSWRAAGDFGSGNSSPAADRPDQHTLMGWTIYRPIAGWTLATSSTALSCDTKIRKFLTRPITSHNRSPHFDPGSGAKLGVESDTLSQNAKIHEIHVEATVIGTDTADEHGDPRGVVRKAGITERSKFSAPELCQVRASPGKQFDVSLGNLSDDFKVVTGMKTEMKFFVLSHMASRDLQGESLPWTPVAVLGLLVWTLIAGTEYFRVPAFGWVMFVAVFYWVLTVFFLIIYITMTYTRIPQVPWTTVDD
ncbi:hypothetical protein P7K49_031444 [Saguinus oedipus]|uniref:Uncharacterized protein n=1 Tax=Saguinus oedipus TaxID=9490 RepID=A0ABQ9U0K3_SAGOE|nr:hypothetical protein P7K49_031444 [Saguinus oedipus]